MLYQIITCRELTFKTHTGPFWVKNAELVDNPYKWITRWCRTAGIFCWPSPTWLGQAKQNWNQWADSFAHSLSEWGSHSVSPDSLNFYFTNGLQGRKLTLNYPIQFRGNYGLASNASIASDANMLWTSGLSELYWYIMADEHLAHGLIADHLLASPMAQY